MVRAGEISVGDELPVFEREGTVHHWSRFAAVNYEFAAHHWDDEVAKEEGFPAAFAMAPLNHAYLYAMLRQWAGEEARILEVKMKLRAPFIRGKTLRAGGRVTSVSRENGETVVELEVWETDQDGTVMCPGTAKVIVPD